MCIRDSDYTIYAVANCTEFSEADIQTQIKDAFNDYLRRKIDNDNETTNYISKDLKFALDMINSAFVFRL